MDLRSDLTVNNLVNGINISDVVTLSGNQEISGTIYFTTSVISCVIRVLTKMLLNLYVSDLLRYSQTERRFRNCKLAKLQKLKGDLLY